MAAAVAERIASSKLTVVVGLGATGLSMARFLARGGEPFVVVDTRSEPPQLAALRAELPAVPVVLGGLDAESPAAEALAAADRILVSPGLALDHPALAQARVRGIPLSGDIELFARAAKAPIIAITGSNGKSTVTTLVGDMAARAGKNVGVGGNLGTPALDLLATDRELYVVELSSFQLELVDDLHAEVATVLNLSPDHIDRHGDLPAYHRAKHRIFRGVRQVVVNRDDPLSSPLVPASVKIWSFGLGAPDSHGFGLVEREGETWLGFGLEALMPVAEMALRGRHNIANALAALALGHAVGLLLAAMLQTLREFPGLPHRCQTVVVTAGVTWIDDSKGTNVGAAVAAIEGFATEGANLLVIAGGQGKGQDFAPLAAAMAGRVRQVVLIGEDAALIAKALAGLVPTVLAPTLEAAVAIAARAARAGDTVLLSPACASFDMFSGYAERGCRFADAVRALP